MERGKGGYKKGVGNVKFYPFERRVDKVLVVLKAGGGTKSFGPALFPFAAVRVYI